MMKLIAGPLGVLSEDFHFLLGVFAKARAEAESRIEEARGEEGVSVQENWEKQWVRSGEQYL